MLAALRNSQSKVLVSQGRRALNIVSACSWKISAYAVNSTTPIPEIRNTGLWMSIPKGPIFFSMLSCPTS